MPNKSHRLRARERARRAQLMLPKIKLEDPDEQPVIKSEDGDEPNTKLPGEDKPKIKQEHEDEPWIKQEHEDEPNIEQEHAGEGYQSAFDPHGLPQRPQAQDQGTGTQPGIARFLQHPLPPRPDFPGVKCGRSSVGSAPSGFAKHSQPPKVKVEEGSTSIKEQYRPLPPRPDFPGVKFGRSSFGSAPSGFAKHNQPPKVKVEEGSTSIKKHYRGTKPIKNISKAKTKTLEKALDKGKKALQQSYSRYRFETIFDSSDGGDSGLVDAYSRATGNQPLKLKFAESKHLLVDPLMTPLRFMRDWDDDALAATWAYSLSQGQIKDMPEVKLELRRSTDLSEKDRDTCLDIVQHTSKAAYQSSTIGWNRSQKKIEMSGKDMVYILVRTASGEDETFGPGLSTDIIGFISFKIDYDDEPNQHRHVVYIFEVHIGDKFRGKGLGKWLVFTVEAMARMVSINKTMLTVFKSNTGALRAYQKMGYVKDEATPPDRVVRNRLIPSEYLIMSKC